MGAAIEAGAHKDTVDPEAWAIIDGKLYLLYSTYWLERWRQKAKEYIKQADKDWQTVANLPDREMVGAPCAASPPTNTVTMQDGKRLLVIGTQVPRDEAGNVVGKGDMRAQITSGKMRPSTDELPHRSHFIPKPYDSSGLTGILREVSGS